MNITREAAHKTEKGVSQLGKHTKKGGYEDK